MKRKLNLWLLVVLGVCLLLSACSKNNNEEENVSKSESDEESILNIAIPTDMTSQDIHDHNSTLTESIHSNMYSYLFKRNVDGEIEPELVETYENINDTTWEFTLKEDVKFHNGSELTAEDVKFTLERVARDESVREHFFYRQIKDVKILGDYHFQIITYEPEPVLLNRLSRIGSGILPKAYIEENDWDFFYQNPIGTGPLKFIEWNRDSEIVFEVFEDYFEGKIEDWDKVIYRVIPEDSTRVAEALTGGVDLALNIPDHEWDRINENNGTRIISSPSQRVAMLSVRHHEDYPTADPIVREAIDLGIDNKALTENVLGGAAVPTRTRVTPGNTGANEDLYDTYLYDPEKAKELLDEAGYNDGLEITIHGPNERYAKVQDIQEMIAGMLAEVGITVHVDLMEWSNFIDLRGAVAYEEAYFVAYGNSLFDAALAVDNMRSELALDTHGYQNEEVDYLIEVAEKNMNLEEREEQYRKVQEIIAEDRPYIYLYAEKISYAVSDKIEFTPRSDEMLFITDIKRK